MVAKMLPSSCICLARLWLCIPSVHLVARECLRDHFVGGFRHIVVHVYSCRKTAGSVCTTATRIQHSTGILNRRCASTLFIFITKTKHSRLTTWSRHNTFSAICYLTRLLTGHARFCSVSVWPVWLSTTRVLRWHEDWYRGHVREVSKYLHINIRLLATDRDPCCTLRFMWLIYTKDNCITNLLSKTLIQE